MTSKERVLVALNHKEPDAVPVDFGGTAVTGMHVNCVIGLRDHYGLEKRPVKVHEPYQMLGWIDDDLKTGLGIDVEGVWPRETMFGFRNENWKPWRHGHGQEVLVSEHFQMTTDANGDTLIYPEGDTTARRAAACRRTATSSTPSSARSRSTRPGSIPRTTSRSSGPITDEDLDYFDEREAARRGHGPGRHRQLSAAPAFGDIALVPAPFLKHPKGIRDIAEWYISTVTRQDYVHAHLREADRDRPRRISRRSTPRVGDRVEAVFVCGTDFGTQQSDVLLGRRRSASSTCRTTGGSTTGSTSTRPGRPSSTPAARSDRSSRPSSRPASTSSTRSSVSAAGMDAENLKADYGDRHRLLGRRRRHPEDPALRHARRGRGPRSCAAARSSATAAGSSSTPSTTSRPTPPSRTSSPCSSAIREFNGKR